VLHHVPSTDLQDLVFRETHRVLRPGGLFVGTDALPTDERRKLHDGDIFVPVDPLTLPFRLSAAGFRSPTVETSADRFRFRATA